VNIRFILTRIFLPVIVLAAGLAVWSSLKSLPQKKQKNKDTNFLARGGTRGEVRSSGLSVIAHPLKPQSYQVIITSRGTTTAGEEISLSTEVEGQVISVSPSFEVGTYVEKGTSLITLDPVDIEADIISAEARVAQAHASLAQEEVRAKQALINWKELGYKEAPSDLVLRKPQLNQANANLKSAEAQLAKAKRDFERADFKAPFSGIIAERNVSLGERLSRGRPIGRLIGTEYSSLSLPISSKDELFLQSKVAGAEVTFHNALTGTAGPSWKGVIVNREPIVNEITKQLHLSARIADPYSLEQEHGHTIPLGQPVTAQIQAKVLENVYVVPKLALRGPNEIHLVNSDNLLEILHIDPVFTDDTSIVFRSDKPLAPYWVETKLSSWMAGSEVSIETQTEQ